jgi:autoinducer-2 kinase
MHYLLAIDAGTGSIRAVLFDTLGHQIALSQREWTHLSIEGVEGSMGFDFEKGWELCKACIKEAMVGIDAKEIIAVSSSSMREGIVVYDKDKRELWGVANVDSRAGAEVKALKMLDARMEQEGYLRSGQTFALSAIPRLLWLKENRPKLYEKAAYFTMISDWVLFKLCGELASEPSNAGTAGAFSLKNRTWEVEDFAACGLKELCVPIKESGEVLAKVSAHASKETGLGTHTLVVMGGGDVQIGTAGLGANTLGDAVILGGSFWQQEINIDAHAPLSPDMRIRVNPHVIKGLSQAEGITFFSGLIMRWFRDAFGGGKSYAQLEAMAQSVPVGSYGIMPIFSDAMNYGAWYHASPSFIGLGMDAQHYNVASMFRSLQENACIVSAINLEQIQAFSGVYPKELIFASGASQGKLWPQILADVTGLHVKVPVIKEATALGVAMAAGMGAGVYQSYEEAGENIVKIEKSYEPNAQNGELYRQIKEKWVKIYAKQRELVDEGLVPSMWKAPGI